MKLEELWGPEPSAPAKDVLLVFIHGMYHPAGCWANFLEGFSKLGYHTVALSLRGHGGSEGKGFRFRFTNLGNYAKDVVQFANECATQKKGFRIVFVAHSMGGLVLARSIKQIQADGIILLAPASARSFRGSTLRFLFAHPLLSFWLHVVWSLRPVVSQIERYHELFFSKSVSRATLQKAFKAVGDESYFVGWQMLLGRFCRCPSYHCFKSIPTAVFGAELDKCVHVKSLRRTAKEVGVTAEIIPGVAHNLMLDDNWGDVVDRSGKWLEHHLGTPKKPNVCPSRVLRREP